MHKYLWITSNVYRPKRSLCMDSMMGWCGNHMCISTNMPDKNTDRIRGYNMTDYKHANNLFRASIGARGERDTTLQIPSIWQYIVR